MCCHGFHRNDDHYVFTISVYVLPDLRGSLLHIVRYGDAGGNACTMLFFEQIIGTGPYGIFTKLRKFQLVYSGMAIFALLLYFISSGQWDVLYVFLVQKAIGVILVILLTLLMIGTISQALRRNKEAVLLAAGYSTFALISVAELLWYYQRNGTYHLIWWKWSMVAFIIALIAILGSRFAEKHRQVIEYSKELELFNNELQRSEKMEIISELAASVAHEVRNPLQVTRGFLQLMTEQEDNKTRDMCELP